MEKIVRINEAAQILGISKATLYRLVKCKALPTPIKITPNGRASGFLDFQIKEYLFKIQNKNNDKI
ncbi:helix-turn-helix transcriptional regulator [uncultured Deefgea sp.]|uniref:helix-turn-helix transcriptional regulator n=1 Tax=uncultured Deefgea sp. TaxID=1304914 RepID=UPI0035B584DA